MPARVGAGKLTDFGGRRKLSPGSMPVTDDDGESKPPPIFKVVSENPNARADREIERATELVKSRLADLAATMLDLEAIAKKTRRTPESILRTAKRLCVSIKGRKVKGK